MALIAALFACVMLPVLYFVGEARERRTVERLKAQEQEIASNQRFIACRLAETKHNVERYVISEDNDRQDRADNDPTEVSAAAGLVKAFEEGKRALYRRIGDKCFPPLTPLPTWARPSRG